MKENKQKFIRILSAELEDLIEDIERLMGAYQARSVKGDITNYVLLENNALLQNEIFCLKNFIKFINRIDLSQFETLEELYNFIEEKFKREMEEHCYAHAIADFVERKLKKVLNYIKT